MCASAWFCEPSIIILCSYAISWMPPRRCTNMHSYNAFDSQVALEDVDVHVDVVVLYKDTYIQSGCTEKINSVPWWDEPCYGHIRRQISSSVRSDAAGGTAEWLGERAHTTIMRHVISLSDQCCCNGSIAIVTSHRHTLFEVVSTWVNCPPKHAGWRIPACLCPAAARTKGLWCTRQPAYRAYSVACWQESGT